MYVTYFYVHGVYLYIHVQLPTGVYSLYVHIQLTTYVYVSVLQYKIKYTQQRIY